MLTHYQIALLDRVQTCDNPPRYLRAQRASVDFTPRNLRFESRVLLLEAFFRGE